MYYTSVAIVEVSNVIKDWKESGVEAPARFAKSGQLFNQHLEKLDMVMYQLPAVLDANDVDKFYELLDEMYAAKLLIQQSNAELWEIWNERR